METVAKNITREHNGLFRHEYMLDISGLNKTYPTPKGDYVVLDDLDLKVRKEEFISIIGHSGCGKSTLLTMIAGLNEISKGTIIADNKTVKGAGPDRAVIFQSPSLFPWMTAFENVMIGVKQVFAHGTKKDREDIVKYYLAKVGLEDSMYKKAKDLSQGMQQRVGIAGELQDVLVEVWNQEKITAIMITHDVDESILLADRVIMMTSGPRAKVGDILEIDFERPRDRAALLDHPDYYKYREHLINFLEH